MPPPSGPCPMKLKVPNIVDFPDNVLQNIVIFCFTERVVFPLLQDEPRRLISQVCSKWRHIVICTPSYWNAIDLAPTHFHNMEHAVNLVQEFLQRSGNLPLSFTFTTIIQRGGGASQEGLVDNTPAIYCKLVRRFLILCDCRLQSLTCAMRESEAFKLFNKRSFPILDNINATVVADANFNRIQPKTQPFKFTAFQAAPILRKAALRLSVSPHPGIELRLPWGQLTKVHLGHSPISVENFMWTMNSSWCLEEAFFSITSDISPSGRCRHSSLQKIAMPHLRQLRLKLIEPRKYSKIFRLLHLPVLEELWLERGEVGLWRGMNIYAKLVSTSRATLKRIILKEFTLPKPAQSSSAGSAHLQRRLVYQHVNRFLQIPQNITALHLSTVYFNPTTLDDLSTGNLLPMLNTLELGTLNAWDIISMVERRNSIRKHGVSSSASNGPHLCALEYLYIFVSASDMDMNERGQLEVAVAALDLVVYRLGFA